MVSEKPLTISFSPMAMWRLLISSWLIRKVKGERLTGKRDGLARVHLCSAAKRDFDRLGVVARRQHGVYFFKDFGRQIDVVRGASLFVVKMRVRPKVRAVAGR